jgi:hypothetical protein
LVTNGAARAANLIGAALVGAALVGAALVEAALVGTALVGTALVGAVPDGSTTLWLVDVSATGEVDASSTGDCSLSLRAQPNAASNRGDSPGAPGAPPAAEVRPSIRDTTAAITVDGA